MGHFILQDMDRLYGMWKIKFVVRQIIELTELGHEQAMELGRKIKEEGVKIDEILYSPLVRAKETARIFRR